MDKGFKEKLSEHVESIFKKYSQPGLHICDLATGGGKSYTIGKLTCQYYPKHFDRIVILCVQNKLVVGMNEYIESFISSDKSLLKDSDKLVIENNIEVALKAISTDGLENPFDALFREMKDNVENLQENTKDLTHCIDEIKVAYGTLKKIVDVYNKEKGDCPSDEMKESEKKLRSAIRYFFITYKKHLEGKGKAKKVKTEWIIKAFPSLCKVYPQVNIANKKVLLLTVHKAMWGIDPILTDRVTLADLSGKNKKTLFLFDESDQAATAMRDVIISNSIDERGEDRYNKGYNGFLQYRKLIGDYMQVYDECYGNTLAKSIKSAKDITDRNWNKTFKGIKTFNNIFLSSNEELEYYRRGVFFSGPIMKLNVAQGEKASAQSFICYKNGSKNFTLAHSVDREGLNLKKQYDIVVTMQKFLTLAKRNTTAIKSQLYGVVKESLAKSREKFRKAIQAQKENVETSHVYMGYPSLETEIHSLFSRFETSDEAMFEKQLKEFITNGKNLTFGDDNEKRPDYTVYSQGVQLYMEEIDEKDNQHRIRLSSRQITTTPEKMLVNLALSNDNSVVLCSATASNKTVVSNFDIEYLRQVLGKKVAYISKEDQKLFDELMEKVSPKGHKIEVVPVEKYVCKDLRLNHATLPPKYRAMFSDKAQEDGSADKWFSLTKGELEREFRGKDQARSIFFQLYRLFQFIEAYHWFSNHDDIHSMIYFQNRTGDKDESQYHVLSCLIDGTYEAAIDIKLPTDWKSERIKASKDLDEVSTIFSELSRNKDAKQMLITAYGSFKAGANLQYDIPKDLNVLSGDNWESADSKKKKDWDAVYLQSPTSYIMVDEYDEKSLYSVMLKLMMLFEHGYLSRNDVQKWLNVALSGTMMFKEKGVAKDKAAWVQATIEQAVGRLCRTRNKPVTTYILYDLSMVELLDASNFDKSMTREFRALTDDIKARMSVEKDSSSDETVRCNIANEAKDWHRYMLTNALRYTNDEDNDYDDYDEEDTDDGKLPYLVCTCQKMNQTYKQTIIKKPVISSFDELDDADRQTPFIEKCYGDWHHYGDEGYTYFYRDGKVVPTSTTPRSITASSVRLDVLMKNDIIRDYFIAHDYATDWNKEGKILHPDILASEYAGEIGEEAFKALVMHYCNVSEGDFRHLEGRDYELADFVLLNNEGSYKIAFDVKNMCAQVHEDKENDMKTTDKRKKKKERLKCPLYTVNMLRLENRTNDALNEIDGLLSDDGKIIPQALIHLQQLINK